jgi:hypothetical protein
MTASVHPGKPGGSGTRLGSGLSAVLCLLLTACNGSGSRQAGTAPNMNGDAIPTMRNVADPNAPFTLRPETPHLVKRQPILDASALPVCAEAQLSLFETRSRMQGDQHTLRLTFENQGAPCRLTGFPAVTLLGPNGIVLHDAAMQKVTVAAMAASLNPSVSTPSPAIAQEPSPDVLLPAKGDAAFELGWTSGADCAQVSRLAVSAPGNTQPSYVPRQLSFCLNRMLMTAVAPGGSE